MKRSNRRKRGTPKKMIYLIIFICICLISGKHFLHSKAVNSGNNDSSVYYERQREGWNLILVNNENYIPNDYEVELIELSNGEQVDSRIYPALQEMFDDARNKGYGLFVRDGYRSQDEQQELFDEKVRSYVQKGCSETEAKELAMRMVALPGTSEHQIGLAVDINADTKSTSSTDVYNWLSKNAYKYGFIERYTDDKMDITGVVGEPWHYRYVGLEAASEIYSQGLCLEEYIQLLK